MFAVSRVNGGTGGLVAVVMFMMASRLDEVGRDVNVDFSRRGIRQYKYFSKRKGGHHTSGFSTASSFKHGDSYDDYSTCTKSRILIHSDIQMPRKPNHSIANHHQQPLTITNNQ